jgi:glutathione S-transferase
MKLYVTFTSPYARLARILVLEKGLESRVEIVAAETRTPDSLYYQVNPSGRVPYLLDETGVGMEDSQVICAYLDGLDGKPRFHPPALDRDWDCRRLEARARSLCDGIAVWARERGRPEHERSPTTLAHEAARTQRMADYFEARWPSPCCRGRLPCPTWYWRSRSISRARAGSAISPSADRSSPPGRTTSAICLRCGPRRRGD